MIESFKHKGLEEFFYENDQKGIPTQRSQKIGDILDRLQSAVEIRDMDFPGSRLHLLKGKRKDTWSVDLTKNYRITFKFNDGCAWDVNLEDYH